MNVDEAEVVSIINRVKNVVSANPTRKEKKKDTKTFLAHQYEYVPNYSHLLLDH